ncbi:MAG: regulatory iron-sulfur-containing complex subunit RicT, partial [Planctomycetota bacterium]
MSVRFIVGRAGTGKTHHCLQEIRRHLAQDSVDGPRLIFLVPEQASLQMERAIVDAPCRETIAISDPSSEPCPPKATGAMVHAAHRAEVLSFQRLAFRVLEFAGGYLREAISESARAMVLRRLMNQEAPRLKFYRRADRMGGVVEQLARNIVEFIQGSVTPDTLDEIAGDGQSLDPMQAAKFHDLSILYRAYLEYLGSCRLDPTQYLQVARERFLRCDWLNGALLWVDGFASMSVEETTTLVALSRMCSRVEMTFLMDAALADEKVFRREPFAASRHHPTASTQRLFAKTAQTFDDLRACIAAAGIAEDPPLVLQDAAPPRFARSPRIAGIEAHLFDPGAADARPEGDRPAPTFEPSRLPSEPNEVELIALPSCRLEVEYAVAKVCEWVRSSDRTLRYRDIAIIARDLEPYHDLLSNALIARDVPFFIDRRRSLAHHPLVELLRGLVAVAADDYSLASVRILLKTGLLPLSDDEADELENYLLAFGISGASTWRKKDWLQVRRGSWRASRDADEPSPAPAAELVRKSRDAVVRVLDPWVCFAAASARHLGEPWRDAIRESFDLAGVAGAVERWADQAEELGDLDGAEEHRQAWRTIVEFLDDLGSAFADAALTVTELSEVLDTGLATLTLGLVPPMVDQVLVGSIERSRHPDIKAAVVVDADRGEDLGHVHASGEQALARSLGCAHGPGEEPVTQAARRIATPEDVKRLRELREQDDSARRKASERVLANGLAMKLSDAEWRWDRRKLTLYFTAEKRVDFRNLVRELAAMFRTRIEFKQIGVRDEAKRLSGIGRCGREYCSASWLPELRPVNLGVAKDQRLSLNPSQISGACG